jgi:hypothetical protein
LLELEQLEADQERIPIPQFRPPPKLEIHSVQGIEIANGYASCFAAEPHVTRTEITIVRKHDFTVCPAEVHPFGLQ